MRNGEQLTDVHITAAQKLIQKQFQQLHARLLSPLLSKGDQLLAMGCISLHKHLLRQNHYDSLYSYKLTTPLCHKLTLLYKLLVITQEDGEKVNPDLVVKMPNVKQQHHKKLWHISIAYVYHASLELQLFEQKKMRQHLESCIRQRTISFFPCSISYKKNR